MADGQRSVWSRAQQQASSSAQGYAHQSVALEQVSSTRLPLSFGRPVSPQCAANWRFPFSKFVFVFPKFVFLLRLSRCAPCPSASLRAARLRVAQQRAEPRRRAQQRGTAHTRQHPMY
eukprot:Selendium_serpulae@DN11691_c0_g1_i1.p3